jgi:hypothetical protein
MVNGPGPGIVPESVVRAAGAVPSQWADGGEAHAAVAAARRAFESSPWSWDRSRTGLYAHTALAARCDAAEAHGVHSLGAFSVPRSLEPSSDG